MNKRRRAEEAARATRKKNGVKIAAGVAVLLAVLLGFWKIGGRQTVQATQLPQITTAQTLPNAASPHAPAGNPATVTSSPAQAEGMPAAASAFAPTIENKSTPAGSTPAGMAWIP